jgi:hypothetical protein
LTTEINEPRTRSNQATAIENTVLVSERLTGRLSVTARHRSELPSIVTDRTALECQAVLQQHGGQPTVSNCRLKISLSAHKKNPLELAHPSGFLSSLI